MMSPEERVMFVFETSRDALVVAELMSLESHRRIGSGDSLVTIWKRLAVSVGPLWERLEKANASDFDLPPVVRHLLACLHSAVTKTIVATRDADAPENQRTGNYLGYATHINHDASNLYNLCGEMLGLWEQNDTTPPVEDRGKDAIPAADADQAEVPAEFREGGELKGAVLTGPYLSTNINWLLNSHHLTRAWRNKALTDRVKVGRSYAYQFSELLVLRERVHGPKKS